MRLLLSVLLNQANRGMDQCVCTQQNDKSGYACVRKNLTNARNGELWPTFDLFNNAAMQGKALAVSIRKYRHKPDE